MGKTRPGGYALVRPRSQATSDAQEADRSQPPLRYVCMPGSSFTGSTLLAFLLNAHPECASIGAATGLIEGINVPSYRCSCGALFAECGFWRYVEKRSSQLGHPVHPYEAGRWSTQVRPTGNRLADALLVRSLRVDLANDARNAVVGRLPHVRDSLAAATGASWALARSVLEQTRKSVFIDSSRDHQRPRLLAENPLLDVRAIHLIRDARANIASIMKHNGLRADQAARKWRRANVEAERTRRYIPPQRWLRVHYEDLCADVAGTLSRIHNFLGIPRVRLPEDFRSIEHHIIGNAMRLRSLGEVRYDDSWRSRLTAEDLQNIAHRAGKTNRAFGFDWPLLST